jgi:UDP-N-acetylmuramoyl-L-alanyl-D-glutamate--2,6-diaminopimelate ligase
MGGTAERLADKVIVTSDNPRGEEPLKIINEILNGMRVRPLTEADRAVAITQGVRDLQAEDVLLVAGKGHESYQEIAGQRHPFSDIDESRKALVAWSAPT